VRVRVRVREGERGRDRHGGEQPKTGQAPTRAREEEGKKKSRRSSVSLFVCSLHAQERGGERDDLEER